MSKPTKKSKTHLMSELEVISVCGILGLFSSFLLNIFYGWNSDDNIPDWISVLTLGSLALLGCCLLALFVVNVIRGANRESDSDIRKIYERLSEAITIMYVAKLIPGLHTDNTDNSYHSVVIPYLEQERAYDTMLEKIHAKIEDRKIDKKEFNALSKYNSDILSALKWGERGLRNKLIQSDIKSMDHNA